MRFCCCFFVVVVVFVLFFYYVPLLWRIWKNIIQLLIVESLDMMWCRPENTSIDQGGAEVSIGILWLTSHHVEWLNSQQMLCYIITPLTEFQMWCPELHVRKTMQNVYFRLLHWNLPQHRIYYHSTEGISDVIFRVTC